MLELSGKNAFQRFLNRISQKIFNLKLMWDNVPLMLKKMRNEGHKRPSGHVWIDKQKDGQTEICIILDK